jgi:arylsulfatase A-like enzyme
MRRWFFALMLVGFWDAAAFSRSPNVVIFYADDMGIGDVGAYYSKDIKTPNIDALARSGVRFTNYYSAAPICSPSRAALLTGRYPARAGVPTNVSSVPGAPGMPTEQLTIAEVARTQGYATGIVGKWHLGFSHETQPNAQGFDFFFGHHAGCIDYFSHTFYWNQRAPNHHDLYRNREEVFEQGQYFTHLIAREAKGFIDSHKHEPFLLYVPFNAPHYPMHAPKEYLDAYSHLPKQRQLYAAMVAAMDEAIGRIMDRLGEHKLVEETLVFFMSDNGISVEVRANGGGGSSGPFRDHKFSVFEGGIRMPGIVSWPGAIEGGQTRDQLVIACDILPTVAEIIGAKLPEGHKIDGVSWVKLLTEDAEAPGHDALYWAWNKQKAVRQGKWKLTHNAMITMGMSHRTRPTASDQTFLADIETDPGETVNLAGRHPQIVEKLLKQHDAWAADVFGADYQDKGW